MTGVEIAVSEILRRSVIPHWKPSRQQLAQTLEKRRTISLPFIGRTMFNDFACQ